MTTSSRLTGALQLERIETIPIRVPLRRTYRGSYYRMTHRSTIITRVHTSGGIIGEAYAGDEDADLSTIDRIIHEEIAPKLIGQDILAVERCWELARPATFDILRNRRLGLVATACVDAAIWDAFGKAVQQPLWRIWGGYRKRVPVISIGGYYEPKPDIPREVDELLRRSYAGMKFKVGGLDPEADARRFREARRAAGPDFYLMADANQGWSAEDATRFARLVADCDMHWFEEPCRWDIDRRAMRDVRNMSGARICAGQSELSATGCLDLMAEGSIDFCNFDSSWSGGPTEWRRVAAMSLSFNVRMAHHEEPQVAAHLIASVPNGSFAENFHPDRDPVWHGLVVNASPLTDGCIELNELPGFGWEFDQEFIQRYRVTADVTARE